MEGLPLQRSPSRKRIASSADRQLCILCKKVIKGENTCGSAVGREKVKSSSALIGDTMLNGLDEQGLQTFVYHMTCYRRYVLKAERIAKTSTDSAMEAEASTSTTTLTSGKRKRNSRISSLKAASEYCMICGHKEHHRDKKLYRICEEERAQAFLDATRLFQDEVFDRCCTLQHVKDVYAADVMCHNTCIKNYIVKYKRRTENKSTETEVDVTDPATTQFLQSLDFTHKGYSLTDIRNEFMKLNPERVITNRQMKDILINYFGEGIRFSYPRERSLSQLVYSANVSESSLTDKVRAFDAVKQCANVLRSECNDYNFSLDDKFGDRSDLEQSQLKYVKSRPASWQRFFQYMFPSYKSSESIQRKCDSVFQIIFYLVHNGHRKTPMHIGISQTVHHLCRSKELITTFNRLGICCSYDQVQRQNQMLANRTIIRSEGHRVPIPYSIESGMSIRGAMDNFDREEATLSGMGGTHDTVLVLFQDRNVQRDAIDTDLRIEDLPQTYITTFGIDVRKRTLDKTIPAQQLIPYFKPKRRGDIDADFKPCDDNTNSSEIRKCGSDLDMVWFLCRFLNDRNVLQSNFPADVEVPSRNAFMSVLSEAVERRTYTGFTPVLPYPATKYDSVYTTMVNFQDALIQVHQSEGSLWCDEGVYHIAKELQLLIPDKFSNIFLGLGGFHMQKIVITCIGIYLNNSGAHELLVETETMGPRSTESALQGNHYSRGVRALSMLCEVMQTLQWSTFLTQVNKSKFNKVFGVIRELQKAVNNDTAFAILQVDAALKELPQVMEDFKEYQSDGIAKSAKFRYWDFLITTLCPLLRDFIRADRESNWKLYVCTLRKALPLFFAFDRTNYARWGSLYYQECLQLPTKFPLIYRDFTEGKFTIQHTNRKFSSVAVDQALEQHYNKPAKASGGIIGITRKKEAVATHDIIKHEKDGIAYFLRGVCGLHEEDEFTVHHEYSPSLTHQDQACIRSMIEFLKERDNPFDISSGTSLENLVTGIHVDEVCREYLLTCMDTGETAYRNFVKERFVTKSKQIMDKIPNIFPKKTMRNSVQVPASEDSSNALRYIEIARSREYSIEKLLKFEITSTSHFLTKDGFLRKPDKSLLGRELEGLFLKDTIHAILPTSSYETSITIDFMAYARKVPVKILKLKTFGAVFHHLWRKFHTIADPCVRIDIAFDLYVENSIKYHERQRRTKVSPIQITIHSSDTPLPVNMDSFWNSSENKTLFQQSFIQWLQTHNDVVRKPVYLGGGHKGMPKACFKVSSSLSSEEIAALYCECEEADDRIMWHVHHSVTSAQIRRVIIASADTDVMVSAIYHLHNTWIQHGLQELWLLRDTGQSIRFIPLHTLVPNMPTELVQVLPAVHALSGCDSTSKVGTKHSALKIASTHSYLLDDFGKTTLTDNMTVNAEKYITLVLGSHRDTCDQSRYEHYHRMKSPVDFAVLHPTSTSISFHILRAYLQCYAWINILDQTAKKLDPLQYGYGLEKESDILIPIITVEVRPPDFIQPCTCQKCARENVCPCRKGHIPCCAFCKCAVGKLCQNKYD